MYNDHGDDSHGCGDNKVGYFHLGDKGGCGWGCEETDTVTWTFLEIVREIFLGKTRIKIVPCDLA